MKGEGCAACAGNLRHTRHIIGHRSVDVWEMCERECSRPARDEGEATRDARHDVYAASKQSCQQTRRNHKPSAHLRRCGGRCCRRRLLCASPLFLRVRGPRGVDRRRLDSSKRGRRQARTTGNGSTPSSPSSPIACSWGTHTIEGWIKGSRIPIIYSINLRLNKKNKKSIATDRNSMGLIRNRNR